MHGYCPGKIFEQPGDHNGATEDIKLTRKVGSSGSGWAYFDGKAELDKSAPLDVSIQSHSCS